MTYMDYIAENLTWWLFGYTEDYWYVQADSADPFDGECA
jgi:hypothetical protein